jgi:hypothetical protein
LPLFILAAAYLVATIDIRSHDGRVARGVELAGVNVGGLDNAELDAELERINSFVVTAPVYIETPEAAYQIDAERLGLQLDRTATRLAAKAAQRCVRSHGSVRCSQPTKSMQCCAWTERPQRQGSPRYRRRSVSSRANRRSS